jgi:hypothetical protein
MNDFKGKQKSNNPIEHSSMPAVLISLVELRFKIQRRTKIKNQQVS